MEAAVERTRALLGYRDTAQLRPLLLVEAAGRRETDAQTSPGPSDAVAPPCSVAETALGALLSGISDDTVGVATTAWLQRHGEWFGRNLQVVARQMLKFAAPVTMSSTAGALRQCATLLEMAEPRFGRVLTATAALGPRLEDDAFDADTDQGCATRGGLVLARSDIVQSWKNCRNPDTLLSVAPSALTWTTGPLPPYETVLRWNGATPMLRRTRLQLEAAADRYADKYSQPRQTASRGTA